ncbi:MAG: helix-turn-helix transcriptional regulator [Candidatus Izemoplasmatales bacterium]
MGKNRLKEIREEKGLSQRELARMTKIGNDQISRYESGQKMNEDVIREICIALDVKADYLLGLNQNKNE